MQALMPDEIIPTSDPSEIELELREVVAEVRLVSSSKWELGSLQLVQVDEGPEEVNFSNPKTEYGTPSLPPFSTSAFSSTSPSPRSAMTGSDPFSDGQGHFAEIVDNVSDLYGNTHSEQSLSPTFSELIGGGSLSLRSPIPWYKTYSPFISFPIPYPSTPPSHRNISMKTRRLEIDLMAAQARVHLLEEQLDRYRELVRSACISS